MIQDSRLMDHAAPRFDGGLAIALSNGLSANIANKQLVVVDRWNDEEGEIQYDAKYMEVLINRLKDFSPGLLPRIGSAFFSAAYLMVDQDAEEFSLWEIEPDNQYGFKSDGQLGLMEQQLVPICTAKDERLAIQPGSADAEDGNFQEKSTNNPLSRGAIVGIAVGALSGAAFLGTLLFFLIRRLVFHKHNGKLSRPAGNELDSRPTVLHTSPKEIWGNEKPAVRHEMPHGMGSPRCLGIDMGNTGRYPYQRNVIVYEMPATPYR